jgi:hypothetical protein
MDAFWYVQSSTPIRKMEDLAGKKTYSRPGSSTHMAALAIADQIDPGPAAHGLPNQLRLQPIR